MEFHPVGHTLASGSMDNTVRFWIRPRPDDGKVVNEEEL